MIELKHCNIMFEKKRIMINGINAQGKDIELEVLEVPADCPDDEFIVLAKDGNLYRIEVETLKDFPAF